MVLGFHQHIERLGAYVGDNPPWTKNLDWMSTFSRPTAPRCVGLPTYLVLLYPIIYSYNPGICTFAPDISPCPSIKVDLHALSLKAKETEDSHGRRPNYQIDKQRW